MKLEEGFLKDVIKRLRACKDLGDKTFEQLTDDAMLYQPNEDSNSIATIVQHLHGNMLSRFTNFLTEDGEKPWRNRDAEFDNKILGKSDVLALWNEGWHCVLQVIASLAPADLMKTIYIRTEPLIVYDAILRQLAHYPYHVGQIIYIAKLLKGDSWQSLSIAKGDSNQYNRQMTQQHNSQ